MLAQQLIDGGVVGSVCALFALGFILIFGVRHVLNLAHGSACTRGAFIGLIAVAPAGVFGGAPAAQFLPLPVALLAAMTSAACSACC